MYLQTASLRSDNCSPSPGQLFGIVRNGCPASFGITVRHHRNTHSRAHLRQLPNIYRIEKKKISILTIRHGKQILPINEIMEQQCKFTRTVKAAQLRSAYLAAGYLSRSLQIPDFTCRRYVVIMS